MTGLRLSIGRTHCDVSAEPERGEDVAPIREVILGSTAEDECRVFVYLSDISFEVVTVKDIREIARMARLARQQRQESAK